MARKTRAGSDAPRVVVVGLGFAGLAAVSRLARAGLSVTLIDRNVYSTFQPLLYQVATAGLTSADVAYALWSVTRKTGARFHKGSRFMLEQTRVNDEVWLPLHLTAKIDVRIGLIKNFDVDLEQTYRDYKKFRATAKIVGVGEVQEK